MGRPPANGRRRVQEPGVGPASAASPWAAAGPEPSLDEALAEPIVGLVLRRDRLTVADVRAAVRAPARHCRERAAGRGGASPASRDGESTRFARSLLGADAAPKGGGDWDLRGLKVLVAEDEALIALSLAALLEAEGYDVTVAPDAADALDAARRMGDAPRGWVTDLNTPRLGGEDLTRELRARRPGLPVVVGTGSAPFGGVEESRRCAGGDGLLQLLLKPADCGELAAALRRAVAAGPACLAAERRAAPEAVPGMELVG